MPIFSKSVDIFRRLQWKNKSQMFQDDIKSIQMIITKHNEKVLQVKVADPSSSRYEVPVKLNNIPKPNRENAEVYRNPLCLFSPNP
jgi:hypothetical protein